MAKLHDDCLHSHQIEPRGPKPPSSLLGRISFPQFLKCCWSPNDDGSVSERETLLDSPLSFSEKYGTCRKILHYGSHSCVRIYAQSPPCSPYQRLYVVKVFRRSSCVAITQAHRFEQTLSSAVSHPNLLQAVDAPLNERGELCLVTDLCAGGDLNTLIATSDRNLPVRSADCFFKQIMRALSYLHDHGIAHCDIKTENILLTVNGAVKVADFGSAQWSPIDEKTAKNHGNWIRRSLLANTGQYAPPRKLLGSIAYLPPEEFSSTDGGGSSSSGGGGGGGGGDGDDDVHDHRPGDVWAAGLVYMAMRCGRLLWRMACEDEDGGYMAYIRGRQRSNGYPPIEALGEKHRCNVIYAMLHPDHSRRIEINDVLRSEWMYDVQVCEAGENGW
ncbi:hypothetical protein EYZ11_001213 [Aspergillus tanneri]|uniref:non-specific serine/threonine protein kinase n=1 Tax=Aspergillus tanneri TaxID=1220188 RepID=A0A4S3JV84_9EURO|nr:hypothetical protein EYZ11_001213 [Aspergillus tanneri]